jgi:hypothetical protein
MMSLGLFVKLMLGPLHVERISWTLEGQFVHRPVPESFSEVATDWIPEPARRLS